MSTRTPPRPAAPATGHNPRTMLALLLVIAAIIALGWWAFFRPFSRKMTPDPNAAPKMSSPPPMKPASPPGFPPPPSPRLP